MKGNLERVFHELVTINGLRRYPIRFSDADMTTPQKLEVLDVHNS